MTEYKPKSEFLQIIIERGFFHQCTDLEALDARLMRGDPVSAYIGFDATADSLHVGSLMQIMMLHWFQESGHRPIVLMGGGTTKVGDPSGKDETRQLLDTKAINKNINGIRAIFDKYITFGNGATDAIQPNNADWLDSLNYVEFLRDIGRHFTINRMMTMDSVKTRLEREQPLTFLEFNYMLLQSYDFLQLHQREGCELQIGGSDQWGNIVNGVDLTRRVAGNQVFGLTSPLLTKADGSKMGKTASGAIWLNKESLPSYEFWQLLRNTDDADVGRFLKLFTKLPIAECDRLGALEGQEINKAKIILATETCALCHGREAAEKAEKTAKDFFEGNGTDTELDKNQVSIDGFEIVASSGFDNPLPDLPPLIGTGGLEFIHFGGEGNRLPTFSIKNPTYLVELLLKIDFAKSGKDAKRLLKEGAVRVNDKVIKGALSHISVEDTGILKISVGKKNHVLVELRNHAKLPPNTKT